MDAIIKTLEKRGHSVVIRRESWGGGSAAVIEGQLVRFLLREGVD